ncbi:hypothetical protein ACSS6W_003165 [Trichoderma asperelloides]
MDGQRSRFSSSVAPGGGGRDTLIGRSAVRRVLGSLPCTWAGCDFYSSAGPFCSV